MEGEREEVKQGARSECIMQGETQDENQIARGIVMGVKEEERN